tara:strand:+ start:2020 stop:2250 length:231 start_codon:yes stop_codon:yes gene_type:complete
MKSVEYWIKAINEEEDDEEVLHLFFAAQKEAPTEDACRKLAITIHKACYPRIVAAICGCNKIRALKALSGREQKDA